ncbi:MAG: pyrroline-5-carboxylate reductase [Candidatus Cloacimonadota bacterium]|nr:MAG: pyrroline-5-carboxylate reductase [Candidatus Cloacimonadota bacterium]
MKFENKKIAVIGGGSIGTAMAKGLLKGNAVNAEDLIITRKKEDLPKDNREMYFQEDNSDAVRKSEIIIYAVRPGQFADVLKETKKDLDPEKHIIVSVVSGFTAKDIEDIIGTEFNVIRAMPNTAIAIGESMTCIAGDSADKSALEYVKELFNHAGLCLIIEERQMLSATALCSCGVAFFLRSVRAASQGGIQSGFHSQEALIMAAQTAKGAAELILENGSHPESEIDKVTTPRGCTIAGLNEMEFQGFSSAMIKGILAAQKVSH